MLLSFPTRPKESLLVVQIQCHFLLSFILNHNKQKNKKQGINPLKQNPRHFVPLRNNIVRSDAIFFPKKPNTAYLRSARFALKRHFAPNHRFRYGEQKPTRFLAGLRILSVRPFSGDRRAQRVPSEQEQLGGKLRLARVRAPGGKGNRGRF